jgi:hypothetical protein
MKCPVIAAIITVIQTIYAGHLHPSQNRLSVGAEITVC